MQSDIFFFLMFLFMFLTNNKKVKHFLFESKMKQNKEEK